MNRRGDMAYEGMNTSELLAERRKLDREIKSRRECAVQSGDVEVKMINKNHVLRIRTGTEQSYRRRMVNVCFAHTKADLAGMIRKLSRDLEEVATVVETEGEYE